MKLRIGSAQINATIQALADAESLAWHEDDLLTQHPEPTQCPGCGHLAYIARDRDVCTTSEGEADN